MERLTERSKTGTAFFDDDGALIRGAGGAFHQKKDMTANFIHQRFVALDKTIDRLAAYEDTGLEPEEVKEHEAAYIEVVTRTYGPFHQKISQWLRAEKDGRLVVPPCKVGDEVYVTYGEGYKVCIVDRIHVITNNLVKVRMRNLLTETLWLSVSEFGKTVFLTREEAEEALKKMGADNETD